MNKAMATELNMWFVVVAVVFLLAVCVFGLKWSIKEKWKEKENKIIRDWSSEKFCSWQSGVRGKPTVKVATENQFLHFKYHLGEG